jgi:hypothetical protein
MSGGYGGGYGGGGGPPVNPLNPFGLTGGSNSSRGSSRAAPASSRAHDFNADPLAAADNLLVGLHNCCIQLAHSSKAAWCQPLLLSSENPVSAFAFVTNATCIATSWPGTAGLTPVAPVPRGAPLPARGLPAAVRTWVGRTPAVADPAPRLKRKYTGAR